MSASGAGWETTLDYGWALLICIRAPAGSLVQSKSDYSAWQQAVVRVSSDPQSLYPHLEFRVLVEAAHPDLSDAATAHPIRQEELYDPGREVSINPNKNSTLTL